MRRDHFRKSMTSYNDHTSWQDVDDVPSDAGEFYIKFRADVVTEFVLLSFKEKGSDSPVCPETGLPMVRGFRPLGLAYKGRETTVERPGWYCGASSENLHTREDTKVSDLALVTLKAEVENLAGPEEVRRIRTGLGLSQAEAGRLIGGGVRAFQKYESGEVPTSRAMTNLLRSFARHPEDVDCIRADVRDRGGEREIA